MRSLRTHGTLSIFSRSALVRSKGHRVADWQNGSVCISAKCTASAILVNLFSPTLFLIVAKMSLPKRSAP